MTELQKLQKVAEASKNYTDSHVANEINKLDVASVGEAGKFIQTIEQANGKITAIPAAFANTVDTSDIAPSCKAVASYISQEISTEISKLDCNSNITPDGQTIKSITQTAGKIAYIEYKDILISESQVSGLTGKLETIDHKLARINTDDFAVATTTFYKKLNDLEYGLIIPAGYTISKVSQSSGKIGVDIAAIQIDTDQVLGKGTNTKLTTLLANKAAKDDFDNYSASVNRSITSLRNDISTLNNTIDNNITNNINSNKANIEALFTWKNYIDSYIPINASSTNKIVCTDTLTSTLANNVTKYFPENLGVTTNKLICQNDLQSQVLKYLPTGIGSDDKLVTKREFVANYQADWDKTDETDAGFIKHKPFTGLDMAITKDSTDLKIPTSAAVYKLYKQIVDVLVDAGILTAAASEVLDETTE